MGNNVPELATVRPQSGELRIVTLPPYHPEDVVRAQPQRPPQEQRFRPPDNPSYGQNYQPPQSYWGQGINCLTYVGPTNFVPTDYYYGNYGMMAHREDDDFE